MYTTELNYFLQKIESSQYIQRLLDARISNLIFLSFPNCCEKFWKIYVVLILEIMFSIGTAVHEWN